MRTFLVRLLFAVVLFTATVGASQTVTYSGPGDSRVNGSFFKPYKNLWQMSVTTAAGKEIADAGSWSDELTMVKIKGHTYARRTQQAKFKKNGQVVAMTRTTNTFDPQTLRPFSRTFVRGVPASSGLGAGAEEMDVQQTTEVVFRGKTIIWTVTAKNDKPKTTQKVLSKEAWDFYGGLYGILLITFPLEVGFEATFPSVKEDTPDLGMVKAQVTGSEDVEAGPMGRVRAWVVESDTEIGAMRFWLTRQAPHIIRLEYKSKEGTLWKYKMI